MGGYFDNVTLTRFGFFGKKINITAGLENISAPKSGIQVNMVIKM